VAILSHPGMELGNSGPQVVKIGTVPVTSVNFIR
jgi:hypothetical protein